MKIYKNIHDETYWSEQDLIELWNSEKINGIQRTYEDFLESKLEMDFEIICSSDTITIAELKMLVEETQTTLGKVLSNSDIATLLMLKDTCGLPLDVIFMLIHYCASIDKGNIRTIENIGIQWANDGVYSLEAADNKIKQIQKTTANFSIVSKAFGLKNVGSPTKKQLEYGDKWVSEWKFSPEMLREAYERCVDTKGTMNLRYIDGILKRWNASNLHTLDELHKYEKSASMPSQKQSSSYDINELDKFNSLDNF